MSFDATTRDERIFKKTSARVSSETSRTLEILRSRDDYSHDFDYFLNIAEHGMTPETTEARTGRKVMRLLCIQAPLELIHAAGFHPFKVFCGSNAASGLAAHSLPALTCPMLRSVIGAVKMEGPGSLRQWILPTTCDWVVKFPEMLALSGVPNSTPVHWLELPHLKDGDEGQKRWLEEIYGLKKFLEEESGHRVKRAVLAESAAIYRRAWRALLKLSSLRSEGRLASVWFMLMTNVFFCDSAENWIEAAEKVTGVPASIPARPKIFLAGSPLFFPNFKIPFLLEEAGLDLTSDDLCSSERIFPGAVALDDDSEFGLMSAMSQRYHQGCICPTFIDNDRRVNNILERMRSIRFRGVVFHVLKGCHPYDLESFGIETKLKDLGLKFIRLETDYSAEDSQNLCTRLEAYRQTLGDV